LETAHSEMGNIQRDKDDLTQEKTELDKSIKSLEEKKAQVQDALDTYDNLAGIGFTCEVLKDLEKASGKYGGPAKVLAAINAYGGLKELEKDVDDTRRKRKDEEAKAKMAQAEYMGLQPVMTLCSELLNRGFSVESVDNLLSLAKKFGNPFEVLRVSLAYRDLKQLEADQERVRTAKVSEEAKVKGLKTEVEELRGNADEVRKSIAKGVKSIEGAFTDLANTLTSRFDEFVRKWSDIKAEVGRYEEHIRLAKVINAVLVNPALAKEFPPEYGERLVNVTYWLCKAKGFNPKIKITEEIGEKYGYPFRGKELELLDLLKWSLKAWGSP